jgi:UDP-N-acetylmuramoylalanine-D-glutamate ligase
MERKINITVDHKDIFSTAEVFVTDKNNILKREVALSLLTAPAQNRRCRSSRAMTRAARSSERGQDFEQLVPQLKARSLPPPSPCCG